MYTSCLFCGGHLGRNQAVEHMEVGRRLAYDSGRGRLWAVCPTCHRWNLCPFDQRWEALEECEVLARDSLRVATTEQVSLLKHRSGLSLVRLGQAPLREIIPWRFARGVSRRRRDYLIAASIAGAGGVAAMGGALLGGGVLVTLLNLILISRGYREAMYPVIRMDTSDGRPVKVSANGARGLWVEPGSDGAPQAHFHSTDHQHQTLQGTDMKRLLVHALPYVNESGAPVDVAASAGAEISEGGGVEAFFHRTLSDRSLLDRATWKTRSGVLSRLPLQSRIALEAATHLEQEDRALGGELPSLIAQWRQEEPIAEISDSIIEPPGWSDFKGRITGSAPSPEDDQPRPREQP